MVFGVCKGIAEWLHVSEALVRILWIVLVLLTGIVPFVLLYLILAFVLPERTLYSEDDFSDRHYREYRRRYSKY
jgi:phage shock protein C